MVNQCTIQLEWPNLDELIHSIILIHYSRLSTIYLPSADIITIKISWRRCTANGTHTNSISRAWQLLPSQPASTRTNTRVTCSWPPIITAESSARSWAPTTAWRPHQVNITDESLPWVTDIERMQKSAHLIHLFPSGCGGWSLFHCHSKTSGQWRALEDWCIPAAPPDGNSRISPTFYTFPIFPLRFHCSFLDASFPCKSYSTHNPSVPQQCVTHHLWLCPPCANEWLKWPFPPLSLSAAVMSMSYKKTFHPDCSFPISITSSLLG